MSQDNQLLLDGYTDQEKTAYLCAIASIATADRKATEDEIELLEAFMDSANLSSDGSQLVLQAAHDPSNAHLAQNLDTLKNSQLRFSLITDIINFAKSDGQYTAEEQARIQEIAAYLNVNQSQYNALNQFVDTADQAHKQGQDVTSQNFLQSSGLGNSFNSLGISPSFIKGALAIMAPIVISRMMGRRSSAGTGGIGLGTPRSGGLLDGLLGGAAGGMFGGRSNTVPGLGGGSNLGGTRFGGLGSIFSTFGSGRGYGNYGGVGGGFSSILGGLLGSRRGGGMFQ
ncbi:TerB family tellurite resistance protein [Rhodocytophaga aerolata]|uniref:TerB family tellurite resistance protein n=1 Tax=Rhodocytophaga aerolata TaxID=455078 RepID=A0ABT8QY72_9BACT|nr:TerB family tellurite resistance protein [Rhodocytophaga aerolata]MDO1444787.1 TerB family tellurite resistance protein [Rhodocytophaga aerolata]